MRALVIAHQLGHRLMAEGDEPVDLLRRALQHAAATARWNVYYGTGRDSFDIFDNRAAWFTNRSSI